MTYLLENPFIILVMGILVFAVFASAYIGTRRKAALAAMIAVAVLTGIGVAIEHFVETPREQVEATLDGLAGELLANNLDGVYEYLAPDNEKSRQAARWGLGLMNINKAKVTQLEITVNETMSPPMAEAKFMGVMGGNRKRGSEPFLGRVPFTLKLRQYGDRWLVTDHIADIKGARY